MTTPTAQAPLEADRRRRSASPTSALVSSPAAVAGTVATKRTLASLSFAIERLAHDVGSEAIVIALFQRRAYFAPRAAAYAALAELGLAAVVMYAGDHIAVDGVVHVELAADDPRVGEWSLVVLGPTVGAYLIAQDLDELDPEGRSLEDRRRFSATWGFDREGAVVHARRLLAGSSTDLPADVADRVEAVTAMADAFPSTIAEDGLGRAALCLVGSLVDTGAHLADVKARLDRETAHATKDPLTGLTNREGLQRWLGGSALNGVEMPLIGVVMIDLDGFKAVNDTQGHEVGDRLLQLVAAALTTSVRPGDLVVRWGGDEFLALCPGTQGDQLEQLASRMVAAVTGATIGDVGVGASAGTLSCRHRPLPLAAADRAMYAAKQAGGGRVVAVDTSLQTPAVRSR
jgi:diguanylate cyclase (GGDEF)-like protein